MLTRLIFSIFLLIQVTSVHAALIWDNNLTPDGFNGRATSPPVFPNIRTTDDVTFTQAVTINEFHFTTVDDNGLTPGSLIEFFIYSNQTGQPGSLLNTISTSNFTRTVTGGTLFNRSVYNYSVFGLSIELAPETYWIGSRLPNAAGSGTSFWMTSDGGSDGSSSSTGFYSLDAGSSWMAEGNNWHHAFTLYGEVPAPSTIPLIASFLAAMALIRKVQRRKEN
ncbi:hypothetical protein [Photobacterium sanctipauli]|uniref:hypothetical protein n=1 Tax=Photobacterium sanctipauli TaxID=1342794 RepID=UPI000AB123CA|nr:hypothetical protein [Photobacterium sanctipauli]